MGLWNERVYFPTFATLCVYSGTMHENVMLSLISNSFYSHHLIHRMSIVLNGMLITENITQCKWLVPSLHVGNDNSTEHLSPPAKRVVMYFPRPPIDVVGVKNHVQVTDDLWGQYVNEGSFWDVCRFKTYILIPINRPSLSVYAFTEEY